MTKHYTITRSPSGETLYWTDDSGITRQSFTNVYGETPGKAMLTIAAVLKDYRDGMKVDDIYKKYRFTEQTLRNLLDRTCTPRRTHGGEQVSHRENRGAKT